MVFKVKITVIVLQCKYHCGFSVSESLREGAMQP